MKLCLPAVLAMALVAMAQTAPPASPRTEPAVNAKEMAAVQKIRARIEERAKPASGNSTSPYTLTIPNTTVSYTMVPVPAGEFLMGSAGPPGKPDEQPQHKVRLDAFWMQAHEVTWDSYLMFM